MTEPNRSVRVDVDDLRHLINATAPHVATDRYGIPVLECIRLVVKSGYLIAQATDRYTFGIARVKTDAPDGFDALLPLPDCKRLLALFKPTRGADRPVVRLTRVETEKGADLLAVLVSGTLTTATSLRARWHLESGEFPKMEKLLTGLDVATTQPSTNLIDPRFLARFTTARRHLDDFVRVQMTGREKAILVTVSDHFIGCVMSARAARSAANYPDAAPLGDWLEVL